MSLITRTAKGSKLTIAEMDGNLDYLQSTGLNSNTGPESPVNVDFISAKNEFIDDDAVWPSVSLGNVDITSEVYFFDNIDRGTVGYPEKNQIIFKEPTDISEGQIITISGDESVTITNAVETLKSSPGTGTQLGLDRFRFANNWVSVGDAITVTGMPDEDTISNSFIGPLVIGTDNDGFAIVNTGLTYNGVRLDGLTITITNSEDPLLDGDYLIIPNENNTLEFKTNYNVFNDPPNNLNFGTASFSITVPTDNGTYIVTQIDRDLIFISEEFRVLEFEDPNVEITYTKQAINGTFTVTKVFSREVSVGESIYSTTAVVVEETIPTAKPASENTIGEWQNPVVVEYYWVHGVMPNGVVIWEAYNYNSNENINGYWVALRNNGQGEWEYLSSLKMSELFWTNWYEYTYKDNSKPNELKLISWNYIDGSSPGDERGTAGSYVATLTLDSSNQLQIDEILYNTEYTWGELYSNQFGELVVILQNTTPWYDSDDDWYGMAKGEHAGWVWLYGNVRDKKYAGYNMLTGEIRYVDLTENSLFDDFTISDIYSHPKYRFVVIADNNEIENFQYIWSDLLPNSLSLTQLVAYTESGDGFKFGGNFTEFIDKYIYSVSLPQAYYRKGYYVNIVRINIETGEVEYIKSPRFSNPEGIDLNYSRGFYLNYWVTFNSIYINANLDFPPYQNSTDLVSLNINSNRIKFYKNNIYPYYISNNSIIEYDSVWDKQAIISTIETFKKDSFI
jgi:hypothetical protein